MLVSAIQIEGSAIETHQQRPPSWVDGAPLLLPCQDLTSWIFVDGECSCALDAGGGLAVASGRFF